MRSFPALVLAFLVLGVLGGVALGAGVLFGRNTAPQPKSTVATAARVAGALQTTGATGTGTPAASGRGGGGGDEGGASAAGTPGAAAQRGVAAGLVERLTGTVLAVRTQAGSLSNANLASDTNILTYTTGNKDDLTPGALVTVIGRPGQNGTLDGGTIVVTPPGINIGMILGEGAAGGQGGGGGHDGQGGGGAGGGAAGTPRATGRGGAASGTMGAVDSLTDDVLTVRTQVGTLIKVNLGSDARILTYTAGSKDDLAQGARVTVVGQPGQNAAIDANTVVVVPPSINIATIFGAGGGAGGGGDAGDRGGPSGTPAPGHSGQGEGRPPSSPTP